MQKRILEMSLLELKLKNDSNKLFGSSFIILSSLLGYIYVLVFVLNIRL